MFTIRRHRGPLITCRSLLVVLTLTLVAMLVPALALANPTVAAPPPFDLGDAPDNTTHFPVVYLAYAGVPGRFPTVFDPATGLVQGPRHNNLVPNGWLGAGISGEQDADLMPDADGFTNLIPGGATSNRDKFDDGVPPPNPGGIIKLPQCARTQFRYIVTGAAAVPVPNNYVNVWFDWNRDGDWEDIFTCVSGTTALIVPEWAVQNQPVNVVPGSVVWATPPFASFHPVASDLIWMRINIADAPAPLNPGTGRADGRGPPIAYRFGETEDYLARLTGAAGQYQVVINP